MCCREIRSNPTSFLGVLSTRTPRDQSDWGLFSDLFYLKLALRQTLKKKKKGRRKEEEREKKKEGEVEKKENINLYLLNRGGLFLSLEKRGRVKILVNLTTKNK